MIRKIPSSWVINQFAMNRERGGFEGRPQRTAALALPDQQPQLDASLDHASSQVDDNHTVNKIITITASKPTL
ncbi:hypothetical protein RRG08_063328 [Elysia crispata]|uniref:Uncharacterized protein n=1 Tax=Elysia crispata TaxID=231223 RepID=A0AAE1DN26_9GAST|nr:hypothetical protein RRG08_063328 [Elysia crispata]